MFISNTSTCMYEYIFIRCYFVAVRTCYVYFFRNIYWYWYIQVRVMMSYEISRDWPCTFAYYLCPDLFWLCTIVSRQKNTGCTSIVIQTVRTYTWKQSSTYIIVRMMCVRTTYKVGMILISHWYVRLLHHCSYTLSVESRSLLASILYRAVCRRCTRVRQRVFMTHGRRVGLRAPPPCCRKQGVHVFIIHMG